jgi:hypothetical protein
MAHNQAIRSDTQLRGTHWSALVASSLAAQLRAGDGQCYVSKIEK